MREARDVAEKPRDALYQVKFCLLLQTNVRNDSSFIYSKANDDNSTVQIMAVWTVQIHSKFLAVWWSVYCFLLIFRGTSLTISNMASLWLNSQICSTERLFGAIIPADFTAVFVVRKSVSKLAVALTARRYVQQSQYNTVNFWEIDSRTNGQTDTGLWHIAP